MLFTTLGRTVVALVACAPLAATVGTDEAPVPGFWVRHEHALNYVGYTSHYSCDGLRDTLKQLLKAAGARADVKVTMSCSNPFQGPSAIADATATFYTLALEPPAAPVATPVTLAGTSAGAAAVEPGVGAWKHIEWRANRPSWLAEGDCELVEHFERELLPLFTTRHRVSHMECVPHDIVVGGLSLEFESLAPLARVTPASAARPQ